MSPYNTEAKFLVSDWGNIVYYGTTIVDYISQSGKKNLVTGRCQTVVFTWMNNFRIGIYVDVEYERASRNI
jgi:hypothetical protein